MVYLDYAANCPIEKDVLNVFNETTLKYYANPNSNHKLGLEAKKIIDDASLEIGKYLRVEPEEIIYTSGAVEANNLAIKGISERYKNRGKHILLGSLEHTSILQAATSLQNKGFETELIEVNKDGLINIEDLKSKLREDTILVSICSVDSELGIRQPIEEIGKLLQNHDAIFHTDASQAIGKVDIDFSLCDLITLTPHKFYGLSGIGILVKRKNISLIPQIEGGKSTTVYRSGTPTTALIAASQKAIEIAFKYQQERSKYVTKLNKKIIDELKKYPNVIFNSNENSLPHYINISIKNIKSNTFALLLEKNQIYISTKTSCCPTQTPSKLVYALTKDKMLASTSLRISLSYMTTEEEINEFLKIFDKCYKELNNGEV